MENITTPAMPAHSGKAGMIAMSVGLLLIGLVAGYALGKTGTSNVASQTATPTISITVSPMNTSEWKMYDSVYGFKIFYPPTWTSSEAGSNETSVNLLVLQGPVQGEIPSMVSVHADIKDAKTLAQNDLLKLEKFESVTSDTSVSFAGIAARKIMIASDYGPTTSTLYFDHKGWGYRVSVLQEDEESMTVLNTLVLTK